MATHKKDHNGQWLLLTAVFIIATCGLIYELVAGTLASYLLGDSVTQFSTVIGAYLFSMGIGSFLSKYFKTGLLRWFIMLELLVGLVGGFSAPLLFLVFPLAASFRLILYALIGLTGILVGLEIPLLMRILHNRVEFSQLISRVFTFDYIGALLASLIFPLLLVPHLGLMRTSLFFGMLNCGVGLYLVFRFSGELTGKNTLNLAGILILLAQLITFLYSGKLMTYSESMTFNDRVIFARSTVYQRIVITRNRRELRLFLNGNLQFSTADEYRYHEALVHPALSSLSRPANVLVLGGGDGLAVREILKYPSVTHITLVDLDAAMTRLFSTQPMLLQINHASLLDKKITVLNQDAFLFLQQCRQQFDAVIVDFPDPSNFSIGKLYSTAFYRLLKGVICPGGLAVVQSTSPYVAPKSFWCVAATLQAAGLYTLPYHNYVPSFGEWGYILAGHSPDHAWFRQLPAKLKFLNGSVLRQMMIFPDDMKPVSMPAANRLNNQVLVTYFEEEWNKYLDQ